METEKNQPVVVHHVQLEVGRCTPNMKHQLFCEIRRRRGIFGIGDFVTSFGQRGLSQYETDEFGIIVTSSISRECCLT